MLKRLIRTMSTAEISIKQALGATLRPQHLEIADVSGGCGTSYNVVIVSEQFIGKSLLQRHRMVNDILKSQIAAMHAFSQVSLTPEQWEERKNKQK